MISQEFYAENRLVSFLFNKKLKHFPPKDRIRVIETTYYTVVNGDTLYKIASNLFGEGGERYWVIISDLNGYRKPTDLQIGEVLKLPLVIVQEKFDRLTPLYEQNTSTATPV
jgi:hypothetical protein